MKKAKRRLVYIQVVLCHCVVLCQLRSKDVASYHSIKCSGSIRHEDISLNDFYMENECRVKESILNVKRRRKFGIKKCLLLYCSSSVSG